MIDDTNAAQAIPETPEAPPSGPGVRKSGRKPMSAEAKARKAAHATAKRAKPAAVPIAKQIASMAPKKKAKPAKAKPARKPKKDASKRSGKGSAGSARVKKKSPKRGAKVAAKRPTKAAKRKKYVRDGKLAKSGKFAIIMWGTEAFRKKLDRARGKVSRTQFVRSLVEKKIGVPSRKATKRS